jgi:hypothetical protein
MRMRRWKQLSQQKGCPVYAKLLGSLFISKSAKIKIGKHPVPETSCGSPGRYCRQLLREYIPEARPASVPQPPLGMGASCAVIPGAGFRALQVAAEAPEATHLASPVLAADGLRVRDTTGAILGHDRGSDRDFRVRRGCDRAFRDRLRARDPVHDLHRRDRGRGQQKQRFATDTKTTPCSQAGANFFETFLSLVDGRYDLHTKGALPERQVTGVPCTPP